jgi:L-amino acid N-acyltransferase YncA
MVEVRMAAPSDAQGILDIYAPHIRESFCTFESEVPSLEQFSHRIEKTIQTKPWIVCTVNNVIACYAYASIHRERVAYQWCCESSIYTSNDFKGRGIGRRLYKALFAILKKQGYRNVYAGITLPNEPSIKLHEKCGFAHFATYENIGYKLGEWKNVGWWNLRLNKYDPEPSPPLKFSEMDLLQFEAMLSDAANHILQKLVY